MRKLISIALLALALSVPLKRLDIAKLQPVEGVAIYSEDQRVVLETDTGSRGVGETALEALKDMKDKALSVIYLDTAEYLFVEEGMENFAEELRPLLNGAVRVGEYLEMKAEELVAYYEIHGNLPKLKSWNMDENGK